MGKFFQNNYASAYAAKNVKQALDKLIDVLRSSEQDLRRLVIGQGRRKLPHTKPSKIAFDTPANTPLWMESTSASMANYHTLNAGSEKTITPPPGDNPSNKRKTSSRCSDASSYISIDAYNQMWTRSLREYPVGGNRAPARYRQKSAPANILEEGWSCVPRKPGYLADPIADTLTC